MTSSSNRNRSLPAVRIDGRLIIALGILVTGSTSTLALGDRELGKASWEAPIPADVRTKLDPWLHKLQLDTNQHRAIEAIWAAPDPTESDPGTSLFDRVTSTIATADPETRKWIEACRTADRLELAPFSEQLSNNTSLPPFVRNHLHLLFAKTFVWLHLDDEAFAHLKLLDVTDVADPSSLLFYRGIVEYRFRQKEAGLSTLTRLLENESILPARFINVARLMQADLQGLEKDSLDEAARLMESIRARLHHGRAGTRVRDEEQKVVDILDKLIAELENQQQQMQQSQGGANGQQSAAPAADSSLPNASGQGDVDRKDHGQDTEWGNLPPAEREAAMQRVGETFPGHYLEIIEEYYRVLAKEE